MNITGIIPARMVCRWGGEGVSDFIYPKGGPIVAFSLSSFSYIIISLGLLLLMPGLAGLTREEIMDALHDVMHWLRSASRTVL